METTLQTNEIDSLASQLGGIKSNVIPLDGQDNLPAVQAGFADSIITAQNVAVKRDVTAFIHRMKVLAQMAGEEYRYQYPVKSKDGSKKIIEGGSIKLANDLVREYGNCLVDVRVQDKGNEWEIYARFVDYETGFAYTRPYRQRKSQQSVKSSDGERQLDIAYQIGVSKAIRNVIMNALSTYGDIVYDEAKNSLVNRIGKDLQNWKARIGQRCQENKYDLARIERSVTKPINEWLAVDVARVVAELKSIMDGMASFDDLYPSQEQEAAVDAKAENAGGIDGLKAKIAQEKQPEHNPETGEIKQDDNTFPADRP